MKKYNTIESIASILVDDLLDTCYPSTEDYLRKDSTLTDAEIEQIRRKIEDYIAELRKKLDNIYNQVDNETILECAKVCGSCLHNQKSAIDGAMICKLTSATTEEEFVKRSREDCWTPIPLDFDPMYNCVK